jgi:hypothetical protein
MTDIPIREPNNSEPETGPQLTPPGPPAPPQNSPLMRMPGLAAIALYMLFLAGVVIIGVAGKHYPPLYLVFPALFIAAGFGLLLLLRWAWALALAAIVMLMGVFLYQFARAHAPSALVQGLLNVVFFLYLVRTEVRSHLR